MHALIAYACFFAAKSGGMWDDRTISPKRLGISFAYGKKMLEWKGIIYKV